MRNTWTYREPWGDRYDLSFSLIGTKLHPPCMRGNLVPRPRLSALLDEGLRPGNRLILISAPAGYGKTTLAAAWLAGIRADYAWLSLEESENEPRRFLAYLGAALERPAPEFSAYIGSLAGAPQLSAAETAAAELANAMIPSPSPFSWSSTIITFPCLMGSCAPTAAC